MKLDFKSALIEEIIRSKPQLFNLKELEKKTEKELKRILDNICEGRLK